MLLAGIGAALAATALYNLGVVFQALAARDAPRALDLKLSLLGHLMHKPRWIVGTVLGLAGLVAQVLAYRAAPFTVVQAMLAVGLLLLLLLGVRLLCEHVGWRELCGVLAIIGGVTLVSWGAPEQNDTPRGAIAVIAVVAALALVGLAPFLLRGTRFDTVMLTIVATGCGFGASDVATKLLTSDFTHHLLRAAAWGVVAAGMSVAATITAMTAFRRQRATIVVPISIAIELFLPVILGPLFLREHWSSGVLHGSPILAGLAIALVGVFTVSRTRAVSRLIAGAQTT